MAAHKIDQEPTPPTPTINDRHHTIARARRGARLRSLRRLTATPSTGVERMVSIFLSDDGPHCVGDNSLCDGFDRHLLLQWHLDAHWQQLGAEYVMSAWVIWWVFTTQQQACFCRVKGISSRSTKHTDIKVNADPDEPRSPSPNIILIVDRFSGNMVIKSIKIQQSTVNFSRQLRSMLYHWDWYMECNNQPWDTTELG